MNSSFLPALLVAARIRLLDSSCRAPLLVLTLMLSGMGEGKEHGQCKQMAQGMQLLCTNKAFLSNWKAEVFRRFLT